MKNRHPIDGKLKLPYNYLKSKTSDIAKMDEINIVGIGSSFNLDDIKNLKGPIFLISHWLPLKIDNDGSLTYTYDLEDFRSDRENKKNIKNLKNYKNNNITYVISRKEQVDLFLRNDWKVLFLEVHSKDKDGNFYPFNEYLSTSDYLNLFDNNNYKRISIEENIYKRPVLPPYQNWAPTGSFMPAAYALLSLAKKINIYGWDFYLETSPEKMNYWQLFLNTYKYKLDLKRSKNHFECALLNFYYGNLLSKMPNVKIHSNLGKLSKHKKIINKIEKVLFN